MSDRGSDGSNRSDIGSARRFMRWLDLGLRQTERERLLTDIASLEASIERYAGSGMAAPGSPRDLGWNARCHSNLQKARVAASQGAIHSGYEFLHIADRESVMGMPPEERRARAISIRQEALDGKLGSAWRVKAVTELLDPRGGPPATCDPEGAFLMEAISHRNTGDRNRHRRMDRLRWQLAFFSIVISTLVVAAIVVVRFGSATDGLGELGGKLTLFPWAVYLGLLGGFLSASMSMRKFDKTAAVPDIQTDWHITLARGMTGGAASVPVFLLAKAKLVTLGGDAAFEPWGILLLCFFAGFSERWFVSAVGSIGSVGDKVSKAHSDGAAK